MIDCDIELIEIDNPAKLDKSSLFRLIEILANGGSIFDQVIDAIRRIDPDSISGKVYLFKNYAYIELRSTPRRPGRF